MALRQQLDADNDGSGDADADSEDNSAGSGDEAGDNNGASAAGAGDDVRCINKVMQVRFKEFNHASTTMILFAYLQNSMLF